MNKELLERVDRINEIHDLINKLDSFEDIKTVGEILREKGKQIQRLAACAFSPGDRVEWVSKLGDRRAGTVLKVNRKTVRVVADGSLGVWLVSPSMLRHEKTELAA